MPITDHADYLLSFFASVLPLHASRRGQRWSEASESNWNQKPVLLLKSTEFFQGVSAVFRMNVLVYMYSLSCCSKIKKRCKVKKGFWANRRNFQFQLIFSRFSLTALKVTSIKQA